MVDWTYDCKTIGCKHDFKKKKYMDRKLHAYKVKLFVKGYTQTQLIEFEETFSPVTMIKSIMILVSKTNLIFKIWKTGEIIAFLNGKLNLMVLYMPSIQIKYVRFREIFMDSNKHLEVAVTALMRKSRCLDLSRVKMKLVYRSKLVGEL